MSRSMTPDRPALAGRPMRWMPWLLACTALGVAGLWTALAADAGLSAAMARHRQRGHVDAAGLSEASCELCDCIGSLGDCGDCGDCSGCDCAGADCGRCDLSGSAAGGSGRAVQVGGASGVVRACPPGRFRDGLGARSRVPWKRGLSFGLLLLPAVAMGLWRRHYSR